MAIKDLEGREPIGACVTIGVKDKARSFPTETDRWHIVNPREESGIRHAHPGFASFNSAPPDKRRVLRGNLVHSSRDECFEYNLKAQVLPGKKAHPDKRPACTGDGVKATRWEGGAADEFMAIKCPNERCEYRQTTPPACKPFARFLFRLRWPDGIALPTPLVKFTTGSWNSTADLLGFFEYIDKVAKQLGLEKYSLFGLPFVITLQYQTKPSAQSRFPVIHISPEIDPVTFFMQQREQVRQLQQPTFEALPDPTQQSSDLVYEDVKIISVPSTKD